MSFAQFGWSGGFILCNAHIHALRFARYMVVGPGIDILVFGHVCEALQDNAWN